MIHHLEKMVKRVCWQDNLKKSIVYTLTSNIPEILPFLVSGCFGLSIW